MVEGTPEQQAYWDGQKDERIKELEQRVKELESRLESLQALVDEQAEDAGLWFFAVTASETYLQHGLRKLHAAVESLQDNPNE